MSAFPRKRLLTLDAPLQLPPATRRHSRRRRLPRRCSPCNTSSRKCTPQRPRTYPMVIFQSFLDLHLVCSNSSLSAYQSTERVSVRLAARAMHPQAMLSQRVPSVPGMSPGVQALPQVYLGPPGMFIPVMMQAPPPPKRQHDSGDDEPAPKKKTRGGKATKADGTHDSCILLSVPKLV